MKKILIFICFILVFTACRNGVKTTSDQKDESRVSGKVIGYLKSKNYKITIWSSSTGPLYTVTARSGEVILDRQSIEEIKANNKRIYDILEQARANQSSNIIDASNQEMWKNTKNENQWDIENSKEGMDIHIIDGTK